LRASVGKHIPIEAGRVALDGGRFISVEEAARVMAAMPKPLLCDGEADHGVLAVRCRSLDVSDANERNWFDTTRRSTAERGGFLGWLEDEFGPGDHLVLATGRDEMLAFPHSVVELWHASYEIRSANYSAGGIENPYRYDEPEYREARRLGARALLSFISPADDRSTMQMSTFSLDGPKTPEERADVEKHLIEMARMSRMLLMLPPDDVEPPPSEDESQFRRWKRRNAEHLRESMKKLAPEMEAFFAGREMPPEVAAFIAACRKQG
jgi:hypothetical protein